MQGVASMRLAHAEEVTMCFGSDLLGALHEEQVGTGMGAAQASHTG
jgi:hypothetical protein